MGRTKEFVADHYPSKLKYALTRDDIILYTEGKLKTDDITPKKVQHRTRQEQNPAGRISNGPKPLHRAKP